MTTQHTEWTDEAIDQALDQDFMEYQGDYWFRSTTVQQTVREIRDEMQAEVAALKAELAGYVGLHIRRYETQCGGDEARGLRQRYRELTGKEWGDE